MSYALELILSLQFFIICFFSLSHLFFKWGFKKYGIIWSNNLLNAVSTSRSGRLHERWYLEHRLTLSCSYKADEYNLNIHLMQIGFYSSLHAIVAYKNDEHGWITDSSVQIRPPTHSRMVQHKQRPDSCIRADKNIWKKIIFNDIGWETH